MRGCANFPSPTYFAAPETPLAMTDNRGFYVLARQADVAGDRFDIIRSPNPHVGFGGAAPPFCLGARLARREITAMLRELLIRVPDIRAVGKPGYLLSSFINGIKHLPCTLG
jgi:cytochrome P450